VSVTYRLLIQLVGFEAEALVNNTTILLVEDDISLGPSLNELLEYFDLDVELVCDGLLASQRLGEIAPCLILLDLHLPGRSGLDLLVDIRADYRLHDTRVLMMTADQGISISELQLADGVLMKPFTVAAMQTAIEQLMNGSRNVDGPPQQWPNGF
jgi:two-component system, OmpR family, response regulator